MLAIQSSAQAEQTICLKNITVFIVEPDLAVAEVLAFMLEVEGAEVQIAHDLSGATNFLTQSQPDLLFCNLQLPDGDGYCLLDCCQQSTRAIAIAHAPWIVDRQKAVVAGFHHYLFEPMEYSAVMNAIAQVLQKRGW
jgi:CheY-like chemotaxis protein